ncbi:MAG TPA: CapA family protein [Gemmatimonadales bacterium]|nr:CapA family protein [Gemmatimonadales bacterium]
MLTPNGGAGVMASPVRLALAGDVMLGRSVNASLAGGDYARPWGDLLPTLETADLFLINLECALTARTERWRNGRYKPFYFRADPQAVETLRRGGVAFASVANNHTGDFGARGLQETLATLDGAGIAHAGAGLDRWSAREPALLTAAGTRVAVVAFADHPAEWAAAASAPGINYTPVSVAHRHFDQVRVALAMAREQAEVVVFSIHWGPNMRAAPSPKFRDFAHAVIEAGADIFWGHSAHVVQGAEVVRGRLILYDTGDLVDDYAVDEYLRNDLSALFLVELRPPVIESVEVVPVRIDDLRTHLSHGSDRARFVEDFSARCAELGSTVTAEPGPVRVSLPAAPAAVATQP